jgi:DNA (cytosine-5)-methyltransferase 1
MRLLSLCSGIGAIDLAAQECNIEIAGQVEYDPFCQQVLAKHWPNVKRMSDIKDVVGNEFGTIDIVAGGIPCQPFSLAGQRRGTEDDRHLWPYAFAIIKVAQPAWVLIENVAGFVDMALDLVQTDLESEGYEVRAFVLPASAIGAPHQRARCFIMAYSNCNRLRIRQDQQERLTQCEGTPNARNDGSQGTMADTTSERLQKRGCNRHTTDATQVRTGMDSESQRCSALAHTDSTGRQTTGTGKQAITPIQCCENVAYTSSARQQERNVTTVSINTGHLTWRTSAPGSTGIAESRMGRDAHGTTSRLDGHRWPALPGEQQHSDEPPRTTTGRIPNRGKRLKALGNAVVPQAVLPFFQAMILAQQAS